MIDLKQLKLLVRLMVENDLTELDLQDGTEKVALKRGGAGVPVVHYAPPVPAAPAPAPVAAAPAAQPTAAPAAASADSDAGLVPIVSPMVGTFYAAASPDAPPFASVGTAVTPESNVCIIEAMKVFNEIKAEVSGTVAKVLVKNGQPVEFGQPLFMVKP